MMLKIVYERQFKKEFKRLQQTGRNLACFREAIQYLQEGISLPEHCRDHQLGGDWNGFKECHLGGDFLLIYRIHNDELMLVRIGSHRQLFG
jgi:mRNA interferase YafQ